MFGGWTTTQSSPNGVSLLVISLYAWNQLNKQKDMVAEHFLKEGSIVDSLRTKKQLSEVDPVTRGESLVSRLYNPPKRDMYPVIQKGYKSIL